MADTRTALLDAAVRLYSTGGAEQLKGLTAGAVAEEAGFHRQTFYRYWGTHAEFVQDLVRHVLASADGVTVLAERPADPEDLALHLVDHDLARAMADPMVAMRIGLLMTNAVGRARPRAHGMEAAVRAYDELLADWGREMAPGCTTAMLARMVQALVLGLVVESKAGVDGPDGAGVLATAIRALFESLTRPVPAKATG